MRPTVRDDLNDAVRWRHTIQSYRESFGTFWAAADPVTGDIQILRLFLGKDSPFRRVDRDVNMGREGPAALPILFEKTADDKAIILFPD